MSSFTDPLHLEPLDEKRWMLVRDFTYHLGSKDSNKFVHIPSGFITDFASTPRILWSLLPPWGKYGKATIVHDYLCIHKSYTVHDLDGYIVQHIINRKQADKIFLEAMEVLDVNPVVRKLMYFGVRAYATLFPRRV